MLPTLESMLEQGFTERAAREYLDILEYERQSPLFSKSQCDWAHERGFFAESAIAYNLTDDTLGLYLSDYEYARLWPLNSWQRLWINDKLTLKYMLAGTELDSYLPRYYYYSQDSNLIALRDCFADETVDGLAQTIEAAGELACKPNNGAMSKGFHRLSYREGAIYIDSKASSIHDLNTFVLSHPNYVFTEFLRPHEELAIIDPLIHTLRILVLKPVGSSTVPVAAYLRFALGEDKTGNLANYTPPTSAEIASFNVAVDLETGRFGRGIIAYANRLAASPKHPNSGQLAEGILPYWDETLEMIQGICSYLSPLEYFGFDVGITQDGPRILEINSHSGIKYLQMFTPLLSNAAAKQFFENHITALNLLDYQKILIRNSVAR